MLNRKKIGLLFMVLSLGISNMALAETNWLITPAEVAKVQAPVGDLAQPASAKEGPGPEIIVKDPKVLSRLSSPIDILIAFTPGKSGQLPDMKTLNITLVGFFDIDLTDRLREYIQGDNLAISKAALPSGRHRLRMAIKDVNGNSNERDVVVVVVKK